MCKKQWYKQYQQKLWKMWALAKLKNSKRRVDHKQMCLCTVTFLDIHLMLIQTKLTQKFNKGTAQVVAGCSRRYILICNLVHNLI